MADEMGIFGRSKNQELRAGGYGGTASAVGGGGASSSATSLVGATRERAMRLPAISRGRDLLCGIVASCEIKQYTTQWNGDRLELIPQIPEPWMTRPDPRTTLAHTLAWLVDDMIFEERAYLYVTKRYAPQNGRPIGFPAEFIWLPASMVMLEAQAFAGNVPLGDYTVSFNGTQLPTRDVIVFYSPVAGLLKHGARAINIANRLDDAAWRFSSTTVAAGWLEQTEGEPLDDDYLTDAATRWQELREENTTAALGRGWKWNESQIDPSRLQLLEARQHQALELARLINVSPFLIGAPSGGGMTYQNAEQARAQLFQDAAPYLEAIEQTLSSDFVSPRGRVVKLERKDEPTPAPAQAPAQAPAPDPARTPA
jgi:hypothetical protein